MEQSFTFRIAGSYSPDDIPLERLGEYLSALGELLGENANVHFGGISKGSTIVTARVDHVAVPKVTERVRSVAAGDAPAGARKAHARIDQMLREDNATGELFGGPNNVIRVDFAGRNRVAPPIFGPIKQLGIIDGEIYRVEGRDATVHVGVMDGPRSYSLEAPSTMGQQLAAHFRAGAVRFKGEGTWIRDENGEWQLRKFKIDAIEELDSAPASAAVAELRSIGAGGWAARPNAVKELLQERRDGESDH